VGVVLKSARDASRHAHVFFDVAVASCWPADPGLHRPCDMMTKHPLILLFVLGAVAVAGCERKSSRTDESMAPPPESRELTPKTEEAVGGGPLAIDQALDKIVDARCDREMRCGNVGADKKFSDRASCNSQVKKDFASGINAEDCPAGVDAKELDECLSDARKEDCNNPFDTIGRVAACRTSDICRHVK